MNVGRLNLNHLISVERLRGGGHKTRKCRRVTYPESYITKCTTYAKRMLTGQGRGAREDSGRRVSPGRGHASFLGNATVRRRAWYNFLDAPVLTLDVTV